MRDTIFDFISINRSSAVSDLLEPLENFYGRNLNFSFVEKDYSYFSRDLRLDANQLVPFGRIEISNSGNIEESIVHELLHLSLPLSTGLYGFEASNMDPGNLLPILNNIVEHEIMLPMFIKLGYKIENFLHSAFVAKNYKSVNDSFDWWKYEYFRMVMTKNHVGAAKSLEAEKAIKDIKQYGVLRYPDLGREFKTIYCWIRQLKSLNVLSYAASMAELSLIFNIGQRRKYLSPDGNFKIKESLL